MAVIFVTNSRCGCDRDPRGRRPRSRLSAGRARPRISVIRQRIVALDFNEVHPITYGSQLKHFHQ